MQEHYYGHQKIDTASWSKVHWNQQITFSILNQDVWTLLLSIFLCLYFKIGLPDHPRKCSPRSPKMDETVKTGSDLTDHQSTICKGQWRTPSNTCITRIQPELRTGCQSGPITRILLCFLLASCTCWLQPDLALWLRKMSPIQLSAGFRHWLVTTHVPTDGLCCLLQVMRLVVSYLPLGEPVSHAKWGGKCLC